MTEATEASAPTGPDVRLREETVADADVLFAQQLDSEANWMAGFTSKDPTDRAAYDVWRAKLRDSDAILTRVILFGDVVAGSIASFEMFGDRDVTYWIDRELWGQGIATQALRQFLDVETTRPLHARAAKDNAGSQRVLRKCGFEVIGEERGFANARGEEIDEVVLRLA